MYSVFDEDMIEIEIVPFIHRGKRGFPPKAPLADIVNAILYKLKTGVQWHQLPIKALFSEEPPSCQSVYYHYRKWCLSVKEKTQDHQRPIFDRQARSPLGDVGTRSGQP